MHNIHCAIEYLKFRLPLLPQKETLSLLHQTSISKFLKVWSSERLRVPKPFSGALQGQNYFHNNSNVICLLFCVGICTDGAKSKMTKLLAS